MDSVLTDFVAMGNSLNFSGPPFLYIYKKRRKAGYIPFSAGPWETSECVDPHTCVDTDSAWRMLGTCVFQMLVLLLLHPMASMVIIETSILIPMEAVSRAPTSLTKTSVSLFELKSIRQLTALLVPQSPCL